MSKKTKRLDILNDVSFDTGIPIEIVTMVYKSLVNNILKYLSKGTDVVLTGFGGYHLSKHKGHPAHFCGDKSDAIEDYVVIKFVPAKGFIKEIREKHAQRQRQDVEQSK